MKIFKKYTDLIMNGKVGFVPTMGALHNGHLALIDAARKQCDTVVASIFVNPAQFGKNEDLDKYPGTLEKDLELLKKYGCDIVYTPTKSDMYSESFATSIHISGVTEVLCGAVRARHFDGVALVLTKLFNQVRPDTVFMGEKDWQQCIVIQRLIADLNFNIQMQTIPIVREVDGLAFSSRNQYLSSQERQIAPELHKAIRAVAAGQITLCQAIHHLVEKGFDSVDYIEILDENTLSSNSTALNQRVFVAARLGNTRLIDNIRLQGAS